MIKYPLRYRRAIFTASAANVRRDLWVQHLEAYRSAHPRLTVQQNVIIDRARAMVRDPSISARADGADQKLTALHTDTLAAFGKKETFALLGALGPAAAPSARPSTVTPDAPTCPCFSAANGTQDFCDSGKCTVDERCEWQQSGCGIFWINPCNGDCV